LDDESDFFVAMIPLFLYLSLVRIVTRTIVVKKAVNAMKASVTKPKFSNQTIEHGNFASQTPASRSGKRSRNQWYVEIAPPIEASKTAKCFVNHNFLKFATINKIANGYIAAR